MSIAFWVSHQNFFAAVSEKKFETFFAISHIFGRFNAWTLSKKILSLAIKIHDVIACKENFETIFFPGIEDLQPYLDTSEAVVAQW